MSSPLMTLTTGPWRRRPLRRESVDIPTEIPNTDAIFLVLRRMRSPLITLITIFAVAVFGLTLIPGTDADGNTRYLSAFDAFYFMSYTATTIGFGETPIEFNVAQRLWVTVCIFASVVGWAYSLGSLFAVFQDPSFRRALSLQRFRSRVSRLREPFLLLVGYGEAGRTLATALDRVGRRIVVLDEDPHRIDILVGDQMAMDIPSFAGDPRNPPMLGLAGLAHRQCQGVLALTDKDEMNLAVLMATHLLRPDIRTIARCSDKANLDWMTDFDPEAVINPFDRYGSYLVLALTLPVTYRLVTWLLAAPGSDMPSPAQCRRQGRWLVVADSDFGTEVASDLSAAGFDVSIVPPDAEEPEFDDVVGLVAGSDSDTINMSVAAHARLRNSQTFLSIRQQSASMGSLVKAFSPDSVFVATDLVAFETLARLEAPLFWGFIEHVRTRDDEWSGALMDSLVSRLGPRTPTAGRIVIDREDAPAVARWLDRGHQLTLRQLTRNPEDRDVDLAVFPTVLVRDGETHYAPDLDEPLRLGDELGFLYRSHGKDLMSQNLNYDSVVEYLATGEQVAESWVWGLLTGRRRQPIDDEAA